MIQAVEVLVALGQLELMAYKIAQGHRVAIIRAFGLERILLNL